MATTGFRFPTADAAVQGSWTNATNVQGDDGSVAIANIATKNTTAIREQGNFGFSTAVLPDAATITQVNLRVEWRIQISASVIAILGVRARVTTTNLTIHENATEPTTLTTQTFDITAERSWAPADFRDGTFKTRLEPRNGNDATDPVYEFDYVAVEVVYSLAQTHLGAASLTGAGSLAATAAVTHPGIAALAGSGTLAAQASVLHPGVAALEGSATLAAVAAVTHTGVAALAGAGTIAATGAVLGTQLGEAALTGTATLAAAGSVLHPGIAALSGSATLAATASALRPGAASLAGSGSLAAVATVTHAAQVALDGTATLAAEGRVTAAGVAALSGTATLAATGSVTRLAAASLNGIASLAATGTIERTGAAALAGVASIVASGTVPRLRITLRKSDGTLATNETVAYMILEYQAAEHANYGLREGKGTATTDSAGELTLPYPGAAPVGQNAWVAIFRPYPNPVESAIWHDEVTA